MTRSESSKTIIRGTGITAVLTLLSRLLGFVRDLLVARAFGAGFFADAYVVAFRIPNLLRSLLGEGALTSAFVPVFSHELHSSQERARLAIRTITTFLLILTAIITLLGIGFSQSIVSIFAPGFTEDRAKLALCTELTAIMFPYIMCVSLVAMLNGALNAVNIFGASAMAQVVMNLFLIAGALLADLVDDRQGVIILSVSVLAGGVAQVFAQLPALRKAGFSIMPTLRMSRVVIVDLLKLFLPATLGAAVYQVTIFLNTVFASFLAAGSVSWLFYADRLTQLPIGIFTIALASVLLPVLAKAHAANNQEQFLQNLSNSLRFTSFLLIPTCVGLYVMAAPLISLMFERGAFHSHDAAMTALAVKALALSIWASSCQTMISRAFIARKDTVTPTILGIVTLLANCWFALTLMGPIAPEYSGFLPNTLRVLQSAVVIDLLREDLHHVGLSLATTLSSSLSLAIFLGLLVKRFPQVNLSPFLRATTHAGLSSAVMAFLLLEFHLQVSADFWTNLYHIGFAVLLGILSFFPCCFALGSKEAKETFDAILRLVRRKRG